MGSAESAVPQSPQKFTPARSGCHTRGTLRPDSHRTGGRTYVRPRSACHMRRRSLDSPSTARPYRVATVLTMASARGLLCARQLVFECELQGCGRCAVVVQGCHSGHGDHHATASVAPTTTAASCHARWRACQRPLCESALGVTDDSLRPGLHEALLTERLSVALSQLDLTRVAPDFTDLDAGSASDRISRHLGRLIVAAINAGDGEDRVEIAAALADAIVRTLVKRGIDADVLNDIPLDPPRILRAIRQRNPDGSVKINRGATHSAPRHRPSSRTLTVSPRSVTSSEPRPPPPTPSTW